MYQYLIFQVVAVVLIIAALVYLIKNSIVFYLATGSIRKWNKKKWIAFGVLVLGIGIWFKATYPYPLNFAMPPMMRSEAPGKLSAALPIPKVFEFFGQANQFEVVDDIGADPTAVPEPIDRDEAEVVKFDLVAKEVIGEIADGVSFNYWTYNGQVPGPMMRVREGDTVEMSLTNHESSLHPHNIDLHAVTGPGGGAAVTKVEPGETKTIRWKALNPGLYVYHCATANISTHNAHGQYGMILVEPKEGLPEVDHEFYVMQGELYTAGGLGKKGLIAFDSQALLDGIPSYVTFNGKVETEPRMHISAGDRVRIYVGNGGLNQISSFHVIGEIFDTVYPEAAIGSEPHTNVQTTAVLPGGASIVEYVADVPGNLVLVDHALARMNKGAWAVMEVEGEPVSDIFTAVE